MVLPKQYIFESIVGLIILAMLLTFVSCSKDVITKPTVFANIAREEIPSLTDYNITMTTTEKGVLKTKMTTPIQSFYDKAINPYKFYKKGLHLQNFLPNGKLDSEISCNYAVFWDKKELWEASSKVVAVNSKGDKFETELLFWDMQKKKIFSNEFIKITKADGTVSMGNGFESNQEFTVWEITGSSADLPVNLNE